MRRGDRVYWYGDHGPDDAVLDLGTVLENDPARGRTRVKWDSCGSDSCGQWQSSCFLRPLTQEARALAQVLGRLIPDPGE